MSKNKEMEKVAKPQSSKEVQSKKVDVKEKKNKTSVDVKTSKAVQTQSLKIESSEGKEISREKTASVTNLSAKKKSSKAVSGKGNRGFILDEKGRSVSKKRKRKQAVAVARLIPADRSSVLLIEITVNGASYERYFTKDSDRAKIIAFLETVASFKKIKVDFDIKTVGGGTTGQVGASILAMAKVLMEVSPEYKPVLKQNGYLTSDDRQVESKSTGRPKARKSKQWSKR